MTAEISFEANLSAQLGRVASALEAAEQWRRKCAGAMQQVPIVSNQQVGSGILDQADALMAKTGYIWSVRRLTCYGFSAGTVTVFKNSALGEPVAPFLTSGAVFTLGRGELLLMPGERLVAVGTGITGTFQLAGAADCFESWYLPNYIG